MRFLESIFDPSRFEKKYIWVTRYIVPLALVVIGYYARSFLAGSEDTLHVLPFITYYPAIVIAAICGGYISGLMATALSMLMVAEYPIRMANLSLVVENEHIIAFAIFLFGGILVSWVVHKLNASQLENYKSKLYVQSLLHAIPDTLVVLDKDGYIIDCQTSDERNMLLPKAHLLGKNITELLPDYLTHAALEYINHVMDGGTVQPYEFQLPPEWGGAFRECRVTAFDETKAILVLKDITVRKQQQHEREYSLSILNATLEASTEGIFAVDTNHHVTIYNKKLIEMWNMTEKMLVDCDESRIQQHALSQIANPEQQLKEMKENYNLADNVHDEVICLTDGRIFERHLQPQKIGDLVTGRVITFRDITHQKNVERRLHEANALLRQEIIRAEAANIAKNNFVANVSHEIRTPMNGILGFLHILENTDIDAAQAEIIQTIKESTDSLLIVINDILDISKIEAGKIDIENSPYALREAVERAVLPILQRARDKELEINLLIRADVPENVIGDAGRLKQVLINLVGNAVKFTSAGEILVDVELLKRENDLCTLRFTVQDSGIGISSQSLSKLFQPFQQADSSMTRKYGGSGLGLVISKTLVEAMGGTIQATSEEGRGSSFSFILPMHIAAHGSVPAKSDYAVLSGRDVADRLSYNKDLKILLVEDNEINRSFMVKLLEIKKLSYDIAVDGQSAVDAVQSSNYDLVFMDCQLPILDGYQAAKAIRDFEGEFKHTPIVAMTAMAMAGDAEHCLAAGMDDYISKPIDVDVLMKIIHKYSGDKYTSKPSTYFDEVIARLVKAAGFDKVSATQLIRDGTIQIQALSEKIAEFVSACRYDEVALLAHQLKGTTANLRMNEIADKAKDVELAAKQGKAARLVRIINDIVRLIDELKG